MSKVHKNTEDFVPEEFTLKDFQKSTGWGYEVKQSNPNTALEPKKEQSSHNPLAADDETTDALPLKPEQFTDDFSAPINDSSDEKNLEEQTQIAESQNEAEPKQDVHVDIGALTEESYNKGVQAGIERVESDYGLSIKTLQSICEQLNSIRETILQNSLDEMRNLVLQISEKIIRQSVASQKQTIIQTVEDAIQKAVKSDEFVIAVNPDDYVTIKTRSADFINSISGLENIIVRSDASIEPGGCMIESSNCTVDATLVSQLDIIAESLKDKL